MTRRLMLLRHAKSSWDNPRLEDFDRPLNPRGRRDAPRMGTAMHLAGLVPDQVVCSTARRTRDTLALVGPRLGGDLPVTYLDRIYEAPAETLLDVVRNTAPETACLLLVGHNTGMETLAQRLVGPGSDLRALQHLEEKFPTAALAVLDFDMDQWGGVGDGIGRLVTFLRPRDLRIAQSDFQKRSA